MIDVLKRLAELDVQAEGMENDPTIKRLTAMDKARKAVDLDALKTKAGQQPAGSASAEYYKGKVDKAENPPAKEVPDFLKKEEGVEEGSEERLQMIKRMFQQIQADQQGDEDDYQDDETDDLSDLPFSTKTDDEESDMEEGSHEDRLELIKQIAQKVQKEKNDDLQSILKYIDHLDKEEGVPDEIEDEPEDVTDLVTTHTAHDHEGGWDDSNDLYEDKAIDECGMSDEMPKPSTPASVTMTAGSGEELSSILSTIMQLAGVRKAADSDMGVEHDPVVITAEPSIAANSPVSLVNDKMRSFIDKVGDLDQEESEEEEADEAYDNTPEDPTDTNEFDPNQWAYHANPEGAGKGRGTVQPNATLEDAANKLFAEYENFLSEDSSVNELKADTYFKAGKARYQQAASEYDPSKAIQSPEYDTLRSKGERLMKAAQKRADRQSKANVDPSKSISPAAAKQIKREYFIRYDVTDWLAKLLLELLDKRGIPYHDQIKLMMSQAESYREKNNAIYAYKFLDRAYDDIVAAVYNADQQTQTDAEELMDKAYERYTAAYARKPVRDRFSIDEDIKGNKYSKSMDFATSPDDTGEYKKQWRPKLSDKASHELWSLLKDVEKSNEKRSKQPKADKFGDLGSKEKRDSLIGIPKPYRRGSEE